MQTYNTLEEKAAAGDIFAFGGNVVNKDVGGGIDTNKPSTEVSPPVRSGYYSAPTVLTTQPLKDSVSDAAQSLQENQDAIARMAMGSPSDTTGQSGSNTTSTETPTPSAPPPPAETPPRPEPQPATDDQRANIDKELQATIDRMNADHDAFSDQMKQNMAQLQTYINGTATLNPDELNILNGIKTTFDGLIANAQQQQKAATAGMTQMGIRSGRQIYSPQINSGMIQDVWQRGQSRLEDLAAREADALSKARISFKNQDIKGLMDYMNLLDKTQMDRANTLQKTYADLLATKKQLDTEAKQAAAESLAQSKQATLEAKDHAWAVLSALDASTGGRGASTFADDQAMVKRYAAIYGIDPAKLLAQVEELKTTKDKYGTSPEGQYRAYSDFEIRQGRTPLPPQEWQNQQIFNKAKETAAGRAAGTPPKTPKPKKITLKDDIASMGKALQNTIASTQTGNSSQVRPSKYLTPDEYTQAVQDWVNRGHSASSFNTAFKNYILPKQSVLPHSIQGKVNALKDKKASVTEIKQFLSVSGYTDDATINSAIGNYSP